MSLTFNCAAWLRLCQVSNKLTSKNPITFGSTVNLIDQYHYMGEWEHSDTISHYDSPDSVLKLPCVVESKHGGLQINIGSDCGSRKSIYSFMNSQELSPQHFVIAFNMAMEITRKTKTNFTRKLFLITNRFILGGKSAEGESFGNDDLGNFGGDLLCTTWKSSCVGEIRGRGCKKTVWCPQIGDAHSNPIMTINFSKRK